LVPLLSLNFLAGVIVFFNTCVLQYLGLTKHSAAALFPSYVGRGSLRSPTLVVSTLVFNMGGQNVSSVLVINTGFQHLCSGDRLGIGHVARPWLPDDAL
jgi:hypothetical protein